MITTSKVYIVATNTESRTKAMVMPYKCRKKAPEETPVTCIYSLQQIYLVKYHPVLQKWARPQIPRTAQSSAHRRIDGFFLHYDTEVASIAAVAEDCLFKPAFQNGEDKFAYE
jgi:hypothetical protein